LRVKLALRVALVAVVAALGLRYVGRLDGHALVTAAARANLPLLIVATLGNLPLVWIKGRRMHRLLAGRVATRRLMGIFFASYAADNLVMSQAGLGLRVALLRLEGIALPTAAAAQVIDKALEALGLALAAAPLLATIPLPVAWASAALRGSSLGALAALGVALIVLPRSRHPLAQRLAHAAVELRRPSVALEVLALTLAGWAVEAVMVAITLRAMHIAVPLVSTSALVLLAVNMAALVPGLPANVGTFEVSAVLALRAVGVGPEALGFALLYHAGHTLPVTAVGLVAQRWRRPSVLPPVAQSADSAADSSWEPAATSTSTTTGR
jgi:uncharacterized membrane protein YbhN (UPF0104 family)